MLEKERETFSHERDAYIYLIVFFIKCENLYRGSCTHVAKRMAEECLCLRSVEYNGSSVLGV